MISRTVPVVIFFVALLGSGTLLSEIQPFAAVPGLREKFAWFAAHADDYDTVFIGTSRIYRGIKPAVFDEVTAAAGVPGRSFNLGMDAMSPPEDAYVFERLAALRPKHLRWVFIETGTFRSAAGSDGEDNVRSLHWHDTVRTMLALRAVLSPADQRLRWKKLLFGSKEERHPLEVAIMHVQLWLTRTLNVGRGALLVRAWLAPARGVVDPATILGVARDGFMPSGDGRPMGGDTLADYQRRATEPARISFLDRDAQDSLNDMLTRLRALGARPVLVIAPSVGRGRQHPQPGCPAPMLDYGEIEKWPALYQLDHRVDRGHLNADGADTFTRLLAADFIDLTRRSAASR